MMRLIKIILIIIVFFFLYILYINYKASNYKKEFKNTSKVWAHAGFYKNTDYHPDTIESFDLALEKGATATELDIIYDIETRKFVVSHDFPYAKLTKGKLLYLDSVFIRYGNSFKYWLDFKNLKDLKREKVKRSFKDFDVLLKKYSISKKNILLESSYLPNLKFYTKKGIYTSYWITPAKSRYKSIVRDFNFRLRFVFGDFSSISMPFKYYSRVENSLGNIPINIFTINDEKLLNTYLKNENIQIILTDENWFKK